MGRKRASDSSIMLPWEKRGGLLRRLGLARARPLGWTFAVVLFLVIVGMRERQHAGLRSTRASLLILREAIDTYRADNGRKCPGELSELEKKSYIWKVPADAWGRPFELTCPGRFDPDGYEVESAGPDGEPGGLDRID